jgi:hypothetical protein
MKRYFSLLVVVFVLFSCETRYYSVTVRNNSAKPVTYTYDNITDTLAPASFKEYQVKAYTQPPKDLSVPGPGVLSIKMTRAFQADEYVFEDVAPKDIQVLNTLAIPVRIMVGMYIEDGSGNPFIECAANATAAGKIYTGNPIFVSMPKYAGQSDLPDHTVIFDWKETDDGKIFVTIR